MRIAIISDLHANLPATEAVLRSIDKLNIDQIICLGDLVGYGGSPNEVISLIREYTSFVVLGNHDAAVVGRLNYHYHHDEVKQALSWTRTVLSEDHLEWLSQLYYIRRYKDYAFSHGSPISPEQFAYIYTPEQAYLLSQSYEKLPFISFIGHSHLVRGYTFNKIHVNEITLPRRGFRTHSKYLFSVGSVGQPRDGNAKAAFAVFDTTEERIWIERVDYDQREAALAIINAGLSERFATRLFQGF